MVMPIVRLKLPGATVWREADNTRELDGFKAYPFAVLVSCWYDGQFGNTFVCEAEYSGHGMGFNRRGGGTLGDCIVTHWTFKPRPADEAAMLAVARRLAAVKLPGAS